MCGGSEDNELSAICGGVAEWRPREILTHLEPVSGTLFGDGVFADVFKMGPSWMA